MSDKKFTFAFKESMIKSMEKDYIDEIKKKKAELAEYEEAMARMDDASEDSKKVKKKIKKGIEDIIDLIQALDEGAEFKKKELVKILKGIIKSDKDCKKIYKKFRDKKYLSDDMTEWKRSDIEKMISKMGATKINTAAGIDLSIEMSERKKNGGKKKGEPKDKYKIGQHVPRKARAGGKKGEETEEEKIRRELHAEHAQSKKIIRDIIKDSDETITDISEEITKLKSTRAANKYRDLSTLYSAKQGLLNIKLQATKENTAINKSVIDVSYKKVKDKKSKDMESMSDSELFTGFFNTKLAGGITKSGSKSKNKKKDKKSKSLEDAVNKKGISMNDYDSTIAYEGQWSPAVKANYDETDWKFVAVGADNNIIKKFPKNLLPKKSMTALDFLPDGDKARDKKSGIIYPVIKVKFIK